MRLTFLLIAIFNLIFIFSALKVAKQSDEEMEEAFKEE